MTSFKSLLREIHACTICAENLPHGVRPVVQVNPSAKVLIAGQAPGRKVHESGTPFDDASGNRLRDWMGISREVFYDPAKIAIVPMGFCFPGTGKSGDFPPRKECEPAWRSQLLEQLPNISITLVVGQYAQAYHMKGDYATLTETVRAWQSYGPSVMPLPHPSPRNNIWLKRNPWFEKELIPTLQTRISAALTD